MMMKHTLMVALLAVSLLGLSGMSASADVVRARAFNRPGVVFNRPFFRNPFFFRRPAFNPFFRQEFNRPEFNPFFRFQVDADFDRD